MQDAAKCPTHQTATNRAKSKRSRCWRTCSWAASMFHPRVARLLKGGLDTHAQCIGREPLLASWQVRDDEPGLLILFLPTGTHRGFDGLLLPDERTPIPLLAFVVDKALLRKTTGST